jgi:hypothetical protein
MFDKFQPVAGMWSLTTILRACALLPVVLVMCGTAFAQIPPAVGPDSYRSDQTQIGVGILSGFVKNKVDQIIVNANNTLQQQGKSVRVKLAGPVKFYNPYRIASDRKNRPNQYYVKFPMNIGIEVDIPVAANRYIYYPLDLNISCDGWHTGSGMVKVTAVPGPPSVEGGSIIEDVLQVRNYIDSQVRSNLPQISQITQSLPGATCTTIGTSHTGTAYDPFGFIAYDPPSRRLPIAAAAFAPRLEISFLRLKRLAARGNGGGLIYQPVENVRLDLYANFTGRQSPTLTMREGDDVALNIPAISLQTGLRDLLVVIANADQGTTEGEDGAFATAMRSANFSPGQHTLQIPKHYIIPPGPGHTKPIIATTPAYELTYKVTFVDRPNVLAQPAVVGRSQ